MSVVLAIGAVLTPSKAPRFVRRGGRVVTVLMNWYGQHGHMRKRARLFPLV